MDLLLMVAQLALVSAAQVGRSEHPWTLPVDWALATGSATPVHGSVPGEGACLCPTVAGPAARAGALQASLREFQVVCHLPVFGDVPSGPSLPVWGLSRTFKDGGRYFICPAQL